MVMEQKNPSQILLLHVAYVGGTEFLVKSSLLIVPSDQVNFGKVKIECYKNRMFQSILFRKKLNDEFGFLNNLDLDVHPRCIEYSIFQKNNS